MQTGLRQEEGRVTPLDAARQIRAIEPLELDTCVYCGGGRPHAPDCPWLALPQIVAALEAAERVSSAWQADSDGRGDEVMPPHRRLARLIPLFRSAAALSAALKGETP
jgi:hypothetical protein